MSIKNPNRVTALIKDYAALAAIQASVNSAVTSEDWPTRASEAGQVEALERNQVPIAYCDAGLDEGIELFRCMVPFKWWSGATAVDPENALVELVDILHFGLSEEIAGVHAYNNEPLEIAAYATPGLTLEQIYEAAAHAVLRPFVDEEYDLDNLDVQLLDVNCQTSLFGFRRDVKNLLGAMCYDTFDWSSFWALCLSLGKTPELVASSYRAKAVLNKFRKTKGYKNGTCGWADGNINYSGELYIKVWSDGREDNSHMMDFLASFINTEGRQPSEDEMNSFLESSYQQQVDAALQLNQP